MKKKEKPSEEVKGYCYTVREEREMEVVVYARTKREANALVRDATYEPCVTKRSDESWSVEVRDDRILDRSVQFTEREDI